MSSLGCFIFCILVPLIAADTLKFQPRSRGKLPIFNKSLSPWSLGGSNQSGIKRKLGNFDWKDCGGTGADIKLLKLTPDPVAFPGTFNVSFNVSINRDLESPLKGSLQVAKKIGQTYIKIPCIDNFGSCTYDDVCDLLKGVQCPQPLVSAGTNCTCPFKAGNYGVNQVSFQIGAAFLPPGDYNINGTLSYNGKMMACLDLFFSCA